MSFQATTSPLAALTLQCYLGIAAEARRVKFAFAIHFQTAATDDVTVCVRVLESGQPLPTEECDLVARLGVLLHPTLFSAGVVQGSLQDAQSQRGLVQAALADDSVAHRFMHALGTGQSELQTKAADRTHESTAEWR